MGTEESVVQLEDGGGTDDRFTRSLALRKMTPKTTA